MLNLYRSRARLTRFLFGALMVVVSLSMLTYLIPSYGRNASANGAVLAEVAGSEITVHDVRLAATRTIRKIRLPPDVVSSLVPRLVQEMVTKRALAYEAQRLGLSVSAEELRQAIRAVLPALDSGGRFVGPEGYAELLAQQNMTIPGFETNIRQQILISRLLSIVDAGVIVTPQEVESAYRHDYTRFKLQWVKLAPQWYRAQSAPTPAEVAAYYSVNRASFQIPEKRDVTILILDRARLEKSLVAPIDTLGQEYRQNIARYHVPETFALRQILLDDPRRAEDILRQLRSGADFAELARKYSKDEDSARNGGEYQGVRRGQLQPTLDHFLLSLKPGQIGGPVRTSYGYVIVKLVSHHLARIQPFTEVEGELALEWKQQQAAAIEQKMVDIAQPELQKDPSHPDQVAHQFQLEVVHADGYETGKTIAQVGPAPGLYEAIDSLARGGVSRVVPLGSNRLAIAVLGSVMPQRPATLEEARTNIVDILTASRSRAVAHKRAAELIDRSRADGGDLERAARSMGLAVGNSGPVERSGIVPGLGVLQQLGDALDRPQGALFGPIDVADDIVVGKLLQESLPDIAGLAVEKETILTRIRNERTDQRNLLLAAGIEQKLAKQGRLRINQILIDRVARELAE